MADGKVVIDVILDDGKVVKGVANVNKSIGAIAGTAQKSSLSIGKLVAALGLVGLASKGINMVKQSLDGAISRYDTLNNFPRVMQLMGFDAQDSEKAINKLSDGIQGLPTTLDSVASTTQRIAMMTGDLDGAVDTTLALNNAFLASGASTADAERGLEQYVQMLAKGEVDLQSWRTLQETMPIALNETAKAFGFTGKSAQNDLYEALKEGNITFDEFNEKIVELSNKTGGFADIAKEASGGIRTSFTNMKTAVVRGLTNVIEKLDEGLSKTRFKSIENIIQSMGNKFAEVLTNISNHIPDVIEKIQSVYNTLKPWLPLLTSIGAGVVSMVLSFATMNTVIKIINNVKLAIKAMNMVLMANPWMIVLGLAVMAVTLIIQYWDPIKDFFANLWESVKVISTVVWESLKMVWVGVIEYFKSIWTSIKEFFSLLWTGMIQVASTVWESLKATWASVVSYFKSLWSTIKEFFSNLWTVTINTATNIWNGFKATITAIWNGIKSAASNIWNGIKTSIISIVKSLVSTATNIWNALKTAVITIVNAIKTGATNAWNALKSSVISIVNAIKTGATNAWNALKSSVINIVNNIKSRATSIWNALKSSVISIVNAIKSGATNAWNALKTSVVNIVNGIKTSATNAWNTMKSSVINIANGLKDGAVRAWNTLKSATSAAFRKVKSYITSPLKSINLFSIGKNIIQGLINGIGSMAGAVTKKVKDIAGGIKKTLTGAFKIKSPSRWMRDTIAKNMGIGWVKGIDREKTSILKKSGQMSEWMKPEVPETKGFINRLRNTKLPLSENIPLTYRNITEQKIIETDRRREGKNDTKQRPIELHLTLGGTEYKTFVDDITKLQKRNNYRLRKA